MSPAACCIDLQARFGGIYRIGWEGAGATKHAWPREEWPWLMRMRCKYGAVYPYGGDLLQTFTDHPRIGRRLRALPFLLHARGDAETVVRFQLDYLQDVLALLRPYRRRQLSSAHKARLAANGRAALHQHRQGQRTAAVQAPRINGDRQGQVLP